jgi:hypothetical protein
MITQHLNAILLSALLTAAAHAESPQSPQAAHKAIDPNRCGVCHRDGLSLTRYNAEELAKRIFTLQSNPASHPPLLLDQAGEQEIKQLAAALSAAPSD